MALLFLDGFEEYTSGSGMSDTNTNQAIRWTYNAPTIATTARTAQNGITAKSLACNGDAGCLLLPAPTTLIVGFNLMYTGWNRNFFGYTQAVTATYTNPSTGLRVGINSTGNFIIVNNSTGTVLGTTALTYPANAWYHIQVKAVFNTGTSGSIELKVDDNSVLNLTGINTSGAATQINMMYVNGISGTWTYIDDLYVCDGTGTINNDYLGPVGVYTMVPTGAGSSTQMTPSTGANWSCVDELPPNTTDYVTTTAAGQTDLYAMSDLPGGLSPTDFIGVLVKARSMKSGTNNAAIQLALSYSGSTSTSSTLAVYTGSYIENTMVFETQPNGSNWDLASINGLEAGIKSV
jgi:hypothetical protein